MNDDPPGRPENGGRGEIPLKRSVLLCFGSKQGSFASSAELCAPKTVGCHLPSSSPSSSRLPLAKPHPCMLSFATSGRKSGEGGRKEGSTAPDRRAGLASWCSSLIYTHSLTPCALEFFPISSKGHLKSIETPRPYPMMCHFLCQKQNPMPRVFDSSRGKARMVTCWIKWHEVIQCDLGIGPRAPEDK